MSNKNLLKSIFGYSISSWINVLFGLLYTVLSTRMLDPDVYGSISLFMNSSETVMYIICLGLDSSLIRFFNERPNNESKEIFQTKLILFSFINLFVVLFFVTIFLNKFEMFMFGRMSWFLTILLFVSAYTQLLLRFLNILYRMSFDIKKYTIQNILIQSSTKMLVLVAALYDPKFETIISVQVLGIAVIGISYIVLQKEIFTTKVFCKSNMIKNLVAGYTPVIKFALFSAPVYIMSYLNIVVTQNIVRAYLGVISLGIYSSVAIFGSLFSSTVSRGFSTFWSAYVYKNYKTDNDKIKEMSNYIVLVGILSMSVFVFLKDLLYVFIGERFQDGIYFFAMILSVNVIDFLSQASCYGINIARKNYITAFTNCLYVIANAIGVYIAASIWGLVGVAFSVMIIKSLYFWINTIISQKFYESIDGFGKIFLGWLLILIIASLPALGLDSIYIGLLNACLVGASVGIFYKQYKYVFLKLTIKLN